MVIQQPLISTKNKERLPGRSNGDEQSFINNIDDLNILSTVEQHQNEVISMCIVPVKVKSATQRKDLLTLAMFDKCSQASFI